MISDYAYTPTGCKELEERNAILMAQRLIRDFAGNHKVAADFAIGRAEEYLAHHDSDLALFWMEVDACIDAIPRGSLPSPSLN